MGDSLSAAARRALVPVLLGLTPVVRGRLRKLDARVTILRIRQPVPSNRRCERQDAGVLGARPRGGVRCQRRRPHELVRRRPNRPAHHRRCQPRYRRHRRSAGRSEVLCAPHAGQQRGLHGIHGRWPLGREHGQLVDGDGAGDAHCGVAGLERRHGRDSRNPPVADGVDEWLRGRIGPAGL